MYIWYVDNEYKKFRKVLFIFLLICHKMVEERINRNWYRFVDFTKVPIVTMHRRFKYETVCVFAAPNFREPVLILLRFLRFVGFPVWI